MRVAVIVVCLWALAACATTEGRVDGAGQRPWKPEAVRDPGTAGTIGPVLDSRATVRNFREVVTVVEPVAEAFCRERKSHDPAFPCDVRVGIDARAGMKPNAFLTVDKSGRPLILFNMSLIEMARSQDELAFVFGHEMGHLIGGHIHKALHGQPFEGTMARAPANACGALKGGRGPGAWVTSHEFEREADLFGAHIAKRAGYDPALGVRIIPRLDVDRRVDECLAPGGTHPRSADRVEAVESAAAAI